MFEQVELTEPRNALEDAGATTEIVSIEEGDVQGFDHYDKADTVPPTTSRLQPRADECSSRRSGRA